MLRTESFFDHLLVRLLLFIPHGTSEEDQSEMSGSENPMANILTDQTFYCHITLLL